MRSAWQLVPPTPAPQIPPAQLNWGDSNTDVTFIAFRDCTGGVTGTLNDSHIYCPGYLHNNPSITDDDNSTGTTTHQIEVVDAAGAIASVVESLTYLADEPDIQAAIDRLQASKAAMPGRSGARALAGEREGI